MRIPSWLFIVLRLARHKPNPLPLLPLLLPLLLFGASVWITPCTATNGYFNHGYGTKCKGMAGATTALSLCSLSASNNPASMLDIGNRSDIGVSFFVPERGFTADQISGVPAPMNPIPAGDYDSKNELFYVPHLGWNRRLGADTAIGISIGANGGMNTEYDAPVFINFSRNPQTGALPPAASGYLASSPTGVDLQQLFIGLTLSRRLTPQQDIGVTPILIYQRFKAEGLEPFKAVSKHPDDVTGNGYSHAFGGGLRIGWLARLHDRLSLGVSYQSRIYSQPFEDYRGLFADNGDFDLPPIVNAGIAVRPFPALTLSFDAQRIFYTKIPAVSNPNDLPLQAPGVAPLGDEDGLGFGWNDMTIYKFGTQWVVNDRIVLRAGYSMANQVVPNAQALFNILAPAVIRDHYTAGLTLRLSARDEINMAFLHAPRERVRGTNPNTVIPDGQGGYIPQTGHIEMSQTDLEISWGRRF